MKRDIAKKSLILLFGLVLLTTPTIALANSATTTITATIPPVVDVTTSGEPYDLMVNIKSNCDMTVTITRVGDEITVTKEIME